MQKGKVYEDTRYAPEVLTEALAALVRSTGETDPNRLYADYAVTFENEYWQHNSFDEFAADLRRSPEEYSYTEDFVTYALYVHQYQDYCRVNVKAPKRDAIESVFEVFERHKSTSLIPHLETPANPPTVFIGHGRSQQWRDLKDHLHEQHGYAVEAYEIGARAGHTIRDILESMLQESSFAVLVLTGEDEDKTGRMHPRLNVVHELGLFQGALGFSKAVALLEDGTEEFSNIHGIQQIRYAKGNIRETFGDVLATLRREFIERESPPRKRRSSVEPEEDEEL